MIRFSALLLAGGLLVIPVAFAQDKAKAPAEPKAPNAQQERMKMCNEKATGKTGDDRKKFMSACLSGEEPRMSQQERMKMCNEKATGKTGDDRKKYMSTCLSGEEPMMSQQDKMKHCNTKAGPMKGDERKQFMSSCLSS